MSSSRFAINSAFDLVPVTAPNNCLKLLNRSLSVRHGLYIPGSLCLPDRQLSVSRSTHQNKGQTCLSDLLNLIAMRDPFLEPSGYLVKATQPIANSLALRTLPLHAHEILPAFCFYEFVNAIVSPRVSTYLCPKIYPKLDRKTKVNWNVHFVSMVQSCFINTVALWVIFNDKERMQMDQTQRIWGYTGAGGMVQGFAAGYFLWDLLASIKDVNVHGWGALAHAASALVVSSLGFVS